jgi:hypothetical protein
MSDPSDMRHLVDNVWVTSWLAYRNGRSDVAPAAYPYAADHPAILFETEWGPSHSTTHIETAVHVDTDIWENGPPFYRLLGTHKCMVRGKRNTYTHILMCCRLSECCLNR